MDSGIKNIGVLAKVSSVSRDGDRVFFDLRNGNTGWLEQTSDEFAVGDVLWISGSGDSQRADKVDQDAWPDELWVGVVKIKRDDLTVVEVSGRHHIVPTNTAVDFRVGNTVQVGTAQGVVRVLADEPLRYVDLPAIDEEVLNQFRSGVSAGRQLNFDDFGGLSEVVARARELIELPLERHEALAEIGVRPIKGVLFTGEPGTGKTMLARIIAAQANAAFFEVSGPVIFSKWYGQSEELLREIFAAAGAEERAIIFFDEIDSVAAQRDDAAHEVSRRVVAQLLTLMDGFTTATNVVVIAATNRPQDLDVALRRPGRFDWEIEFPLPDEADRLDILRKTAPRTSEKLPHADIAEKAIGWTGAELAAIWTEAALLAVADGRAAIAAEDYVGGFERVARQRARVGTRVQREEAR